MSEKTYLPLAKEAQKDYAHDIVLVKVDGILRELFMPTDDYQKIEFITTADRDGILTYERSALMILSKAIYEVADPEKLKKVYVKFSVINGYYVEVVGDVKVDKAFTDAVLARMREIVAADYPFERRRERVRNAKKTFERIGMPDRCRLFNYRLDSEVKIYYLDGYADYFYGFMVPSSGYVKAFDLVPYEQGMALLLPKMEDPERVAPFVPQKKVFDALQSASLWSESMNIDTVGEINDMIGKGNLVDLILMSEARHEKMIAEIAEQIAERKTVKFVMIAGPSSSGKTSFSHRLSVQLKGMGLVPHPIAVDNYFVDRKYTPIGPDGKYDFESIKCVDTKQFNEDMRRLMNGEEVPMPTYNFVTGEREYKGNTMQIAEGDILVIEGIHCLNDEMSYAIPAENKFRIFISALTQTNIDEHNRIPTSDGRLLRRIVRDARTRGYSAQYTIGQWPSVLRGEENNIVPFQNGADAVFNSALVYEFSALKSYAEQQLFAIPEDAPEYSEARRLLRFLSYFLAVDSTYVPQNSLLKEFIGGSVFNVG